MKIRFPFLNTLKITFCLLLASTLLFPVPRSVVEAASSISFRSTTTGTNGAGSTHLVLALPAGTQSGDVLIAQVVVNSASTVITAPSGWTLILATKSKSSGSSVEEAAFYKVASGSEPSSFSWTFGASQPATGAVSSFTGVNISNPIDAKSGKFNSSTATVTFTQVTTTVPDDMLLALVGVAGNTTVTPPSGFTENYDLKDTSSSKGRTAELSESVVSASGQTAVGTAKEDTLKVSNLAQLIALKPVTGATTPTPTPDPTSTAAPFVANIQHVFVIVMENTNWSSIQGNNTSAPYINSLLSRSDASYADQYFNPPGIHPSEPNYVWMEAGDSNNLPGTTNFTSDGAPSATNVTTTTDHLVTYLQNKGISWKGYMEGITAGTCPINSVNSYAPKHDPFVFFTDISGNPPSSSSTNCISHITPSTQLAADLQTSTVSKYSFIVPDQCNDMHDSCSPLNNRILQGDRWLQNNLPTILNSQAYQNGGAIFITWDEAANGDGPIGMIVLSPFAKGSGYHNSIHYDHSSLLRTEQEIFGVSPLLRNAANATDLSDLFTGSASNPPTPTPTSASTSTPTQSSQTSTPTPGPTSTQISNSGLTLTFDPTADSYVDASSPSTNYGPLTTLRVDDSPIVNSYLRFTVQGLGGHTISRARLMIYANSSSSQGILASSVADNTWGETTITASNAPALGSTLASVTPVASGTWLTFDVTSYITGENTYSFGLSTNGGTAISLASRESGAHSPQLIIDLQ